MLCQARRLGANRGSGVAARVRRRFGRAQVAARLRAEWCGGITRPGATRSENSSIRPLVRIRRAFVPRRDPTGLHAQRGSADAHGRIWFRYETMADATQAENSSVRPIVPIRLPLQVSVGRRIGRSSLVRAGTGLCPAPRGVRNDPCSCETSRNGTKPVSMRGVARGDSTGKTVRSSVRPGSRMPSAHRRVSNWAVVVGSAQSKSRPGSARSGDAESAWRVTREQRATFRSRSATGAGVTPTGNSSIRPLGGTGCRSG